MNEDGSEHENLGIEMEDKTSEIQRERWEDGGNRKFRVFEFGQIMKGRLKLAPLFCFHLEPKRKVNFQIWKPNTGPVSKLEPAVMVSDLGFKMRFGKLRLGRLQSSVSNHVPFCNE